MSQQTTSHLLMIRPVQFAFNAQTAVNNAFQVAGTEQNPQEKALEGFDAFVSLLRKNAVDVTVVPDTVQPHTPDSIFPNNWVSFHADGRICLYPMFAANRRLERKTHVLEVIYDKFSSTGVYDFSHYESRDLFLEGTGSMVLDRDHKIAYACLSPRTNKEVLDDFCLKMNYKPVCFHAFDENNQAIYHTNVMMCVGDAYVVICLNSITDPVEREETISTIRAAGKEIIDISLDQMNHFAGNMLQVSNGSGEKLLIMSSQAYRSLRPDQLVKLESYNTILHSSLETIESNGGGSARCMMAEVHLPLRAS
jgi:hypothetical protein